MSSFEQIAWTFLNHRLGAAELMLGVLVAVAFLASGVRGILRPESEDARDARLREGLS